MNSRARGQTLVLFALTMLLLVVMVTLTLAIGMKAREKIELQTLADATAYSNAVATARVYNTVSVWSRAQVSHMVVLAGAQSHISWTGWYLGGLQATVRATIAAGISCAATCAIPGAQCVCPACPNVARIGMAFRREYNQVLQRYRSLDSAAGTEARLLQGRAASYGTAQKTLLAEHGLGVVPGTGFLAKGGFADQFLALAVPDANRRQEYKTAGTTSGAVFVSVREAKTAQSDSDPYPALPATHGTRESEFIRTRGGIPPPRPPMIYLQNSGIGGIFDASGDAHFGTGRGNANERDARESWAEDDGMTWGGYVFGGCGWLIPPWPASGHVRSTHSGIGGDQHQWTGGSPHNGNVAQIHTMGRCRECPSVWVSRAQYNLNPENSNAGYMGGNNAGLRDQWRQPKSYVTIERDYRTRTIQDPWNLMFNFRLQADDTTANVDIGKQQSMPGKFATQSVLATGITYYHRHMQDTSLSWQEPPNWFNPFWRATLVPADIDHSSARTYLDPDVTLTVGRINAQHSAALNALYTAGFRGIQ